MPGLGVDYVLGWFPAVPAYCSRPTLAPGLALIAILLGALVLYERRHRILVRYAVVASLLVAATFLTRDVGECVYPPSNDALYAGQQRAAADVGQPSASLNPRS